MRPRAAFRLPMIRLPAALLLLAAPAVAAAPAVPSTTPPAVALPADRALASLEALLLQAPDTARAGAVAARLEALRTSRLSPTVLLLLHRAQRELSDGALRDARDDMDDAIALQPEQAVLWRQRAAVRATADDADGAITDLGGALARDPGDVPSWSALSGIEERENQPRQAFEAWEHVLRLDPMIEDGAGRLKRLHREVVGAPS